MKKGFTLIELMVVIVIIGILAAIAVPKMFNMSAKAKVAEAPESLAAYERLQQVYITESGGLGNTTSISWTIPQSKFFDYAGGSADYAVKASYQATPQKIAGACSTASIWAASVYADGVSSHDNPGGDCGAYTPNWINR